MKTLPEIINDTKYLGTPLNEMDNHDLKCAIVKLLEGSYQLSKDYNELERKLLKNEKKTKNLSKGNS